MFVGQRAAVRVPPRPRAAHLEEVQLVTVRDRPPVVVEDRPEREDTRKAEDQPRPRGEKEERKEKGARGQALGN